MSKKIANNHAAAEQLNIAQNGKDSRAERNKLKTAVYESELAKLSIEMVKGYIRPPITDQTLVPDVY